MSRSLADEQWRRFFVALLVLLAIDTTWGVFELQHLADSRYWIILNIVLAVALGGLLAYFWKKTTVAWPAIWAAVATFITTSISYYLSWTFYFPPLP